MNFKVLAALAAFALSIVPAYGQNASGGLPSTKHIETSVGTFTLCTDHARYPVCDGHEVSQETLNVFQIGLQEILVTPSGKILKGGYFDRLNTSLGVLLNILEIDGKVFLISVRRGLFSSIVQYDVSSGELRKEYTSSAVILEPEADVSGQYLRLWPRDANSHTFAGLLILKDDGSWKEYRYPAGYHNQIQKIETMADGRLKLTPYEHGTKVVGSQIIYFDPKTGKYYYE